jgi:hypothetical protein
MKLTTVILLATAPIAVGQAFATSDWCAVIDTPDGFLNLRAGPGTEYPVIRKLLPDDFLELDTGECDWDGLCDHSGTWKFIVSINYKVIAKGWVNSAFLRQVHCEADGSSDREVL